MMKKLSVMLAVLSLTAIVFAADPAEWLPSSSCVLMRVDGARISALVEEKQQQEAVLPQKNQEEIAKLKEILKKHNLQGKDFFSGPAYFAATVTATPKAMGGFYYKTAVPEDKLYAFLQDIAASAEKAPVIEKTQYEGKNLYTLRSADSKQPELKITYVASDVVLAIFSDPENFAEAFQTLTKKPEKSCELAKKLNDKTLLAAVADVATLYQKDPAALQNAGISFFQFFCDAVGVNKQDFTAAAIFDCLTKEKAQEIAMQTRMMLPMLIGTIFGKDQQLAQELMQSVKVDVQELKFTVSCNIPEKTLKSLETYCSNPDNFKKPQVQGAAPGNPNAPAAVQAAPAAAK